MACDCIKIVEQLIREETGDPLARIRGVLAFGDTGKLEFRPSIEVLARRKNKDGSLTKKQKSIELTYGFCPFCGQKLDDDKPINKD